MNEEYEWGIAVNGRVFMNVSEERAEEAYRLTQEASLDPNSVELVRRPVGEWEKIK